MEEPAESTLLYGQVRAYIANTSAAELFADANSVLKAFATIRVAAQKHQLPEALEALRDYIAPSSQALTHGLPKTMAMWPFRVQK